ECVVSLASIANDRPSPPGWTERHFGIATPDRIREQHPFFLQRATRRLAETERPMHEQASLEQAFMAETRTLTYEHAAVRLLSPAADKIGEECRRKHALTRCGLILLAAERFRLTTGSWPETLDALIPNYLPTILLDPFDGEPLRYRRLRDGVVVYSVGPDDIDDGGRLARSRPIPPGTDLGFRLWDVTKRGQPPRPKPPQPPPGRPPDVP